MRCSGGMSSPPVGILGKIDMASEHDGIIDSERVYSTHALARILGIQQTRTVEQKLRERGIETDHWTRGLNLISGKTLQLAIERNSQCDDRGTSESE